MWNVIGMMALVLSTSNVVRADMSFGDGIKATKGFNDDVEKFSNLVGELDDIINNPERVDGENRGRDNPIESKALFDKLRALCPDKESKVYGCRKFYIDVNRLVSIGEASEQKDKDEKHAATAEGIAEEACNDLNQVNVAKSVIAHEKQVGKISGVVNNLVLHQAGEHIVEWQSNYNNTAARYKAKTGKAFNFQKMCK